MSSPDSERRGAPSPHDELFPAVIDALKARGADDIVVFGGGIIPSQDIDRLRAAGVKGVFTPGTPLGQIIAWVRENIAPLEG